MGCAPIIAFPTEEGHYLLDTDASNFDIGVKLKKDRES